MFTGAPLIGFSAAYGYVIVAWRSVINTGDLDVSLAAVAASAGLVTLCFVLGLLAAGQVDHRGNHWLWRSLTDLPVLAFVVVTILLAIDAKLASTGGALVQSLIVILAGYLVGHWSHLAVDRVHIFLSPGAPASPDMTRIARVLGGALASVAGLGAAISALAILNNQLIRSGDVSSVGILPLNQGGTVRYVKIVPLAPELAELDDVRCALSFGSSTGGDRILRVVRQDLRVQLWFIDPQMAVVREAPACEDTVRVLVWGDLAEDPPTLTTAPEAPTATSPSTTATPSTTTSPSNTTALTIAAPNKSSALPSAQSAATAGVEVGQSSITT